MGTGGRTKGVFTGASGWQIVVGRNCAGSAILRTDKAGSCNRREREYSWAKKGMGSVVDTLLF